MPSLDNKKINKKNLCPYFKLSQTLERENQLDHRSVFASNAVLSCLFQALPLEKCPYGRFEMNPPGPLLQSDESAYDLDGGGYHNRRNNLFWTS